MTVEPVASPARDLKTANDIIYSYRMLVTELLGNLAFAYNALGGPTGLFFVQHEGCDVAAADFKSDPDCRNTFAADFLEKMWSDFLGEHFRFMALLNRRTVEEEKKLYHEIAGSAGSS